MRYTWDDKKAAKNYLKHKIKFKTATLVFNDMNRVEWGDVLHSENEDRLFTIGLADPALLCVVYVERLEGDVRRIISARKASKNEQRIYNQINHRS